MPPRGNFDDIIKQTVARTKDRTVPNTPYKRLKLEEMIMEPAAKNAPKVTLEHDKPEYHYPHTRKYDYVSPESRKRGSDAEEYLNKMMREDLQEQKMPRTEMPFQRKRIRREIADDEEFEPIDPESPREKFDKNSRLMGQTHEGNKTLHRGRREHGKPGR